MREHEGRVINQEFVDKLVAFWKQNYNKVSGTYEEFVILNTGWTHEEFVAWCSNGRLPK